MVPLVNHTFEYDGPKDEFEVVDERVEGRKERVMISTSQGIKLGLQDFLFLSILFGRAATYDLMTIYYCYLDIIFGLGCTLGFLAVFKCFIPTLPISISFKVVFYLLAPILMKHIYRH